MQIVEVNTSALSKEFVAFQPRLYVNDANYIQPWNHDVADVFDENKNKFFQQGQVIRWLLQDAGKTIGRIAAFTHPKLEKEGQEVGGVGFFDCINNQEAANLLFDTAKHWLEDEGKTAMDGPINFGEKDKWWGLLVDGFMPPLYGMNYNFPYYQQLFENYGFQNYYNQFVFFLSLKEEIPKKFHYVHDRLKRADSTFRFETANKKQLDKYTEDFRIVYNEAWGKAHEGFKEMSKEQAKKLMNTMKPIMDTDLMVYGYHGDRPIGIFLCIPNLNEAIQHLNGKFGLVEKLKFLYHLKIKKSYKKIAGVIFGVVPDYQGKGIDAGLIVEGEKTFVNGGKNLELLEMMWIGDFNPKMIKVVEQLGSSVGKTLTTYRYLFDRSLPFERHPIINQ